MVFSFLKLTNIFMKLFKNKSINLIDRNLIDSRIYLNKKKKLLNNKNFKFLLGFRNNISIMNLIYIKLFLKKNFKILYEYKKKKKQFYF